MQSQDQLRSKHAKTTENRDINSFKTSQVYSFLYNNPKKLNMLTRNVGNGKEELKKEDNLNSIQEILKADNQRSGNEENQQ